MYNVKILEYMESNTQNISQVFTALNFPIYCISHSDDKKTINFWQAEVSTFEKSFEGDLPQKFFNEGDLA